MFALPPRPRRPALCAACLRRLASRARPFAEGDCVLLRDRHRPNFQGILTPPLKPGLVIQNHRGQIPHEAIIGKRIRDTVKAAKTEYRLQEPTLDEYVRLTPRLVTPIYPNDANIIVGLLDIHVTPPTHADASSPPLQILEAGTGHGALTLHLARAIHAANPPVPATHGRESPSEHALEDDVTYEGTTTDPAAEQTLESWKKGRRAIVHTLDVSSRHLEHARTIVNGFRRGIYAGNVDFHRGDATSWIKRRLKSQASEADKGGSEPFLSCVFLDHVGSQKHFEAIAQALHVDGALAVFSPSITQITESALAVRKLNLPFALEQVVELKGCETVRKWDIRLTRLRAAKNAAKAREPDEAQEETEVANDEDEEGDVEGEPVAESSEEASLAEQAVEQSEDLVRRNLEVEEEQSADPVDEGFKLVCRPKTGLVVGVGGFLGIWRKTRSYYMPDTNALS